MAQEEREPELTSALVDIESGLLVRALKGATSEHLELAGSIAPEVLATRRVGDLSDLFSRLASGEASSPDDYFRETMVVSDALVFVIQRTKTNPALAVVSLHLAGQRPGAMVAEARRHLAEVESQLAEQGAVP
jgi:hypothetical protein